jgi:arginine deiminase
MKPEIFSEIGPIEKVIVHAPGDEHDQVLPVNVQEYIEEKGKIIKNKNFLLFDDIIDTNLAKSQHQTFKDIINFYKPNSCIEISSLYDEKDVFYDLLKGDFPIINLMYTRDIAAIIGNDIFLTCSHSIVRRKERKLSKNLFNKSIFKNYNIVDFKKIGKGLSLEGGDIFVISDEIVFIGISERTSKKAIDLIVPYIFKQDFKYVVALDLPKKRSMMHLDTIFTQISRNEAILFDDSDNNAINKLNVYLALKNNKDQKLKKININILDLFKDFGFKFKIINCGGNKSNFKLREQLTDGANSFALDIGKIIMYNCNDKTIEELKKNGYHHITSRLFKTDIKGFGKILKSDKKVVVSIDGSELVKGRGGPRCMTLPIRRGLI